MGLWCLNNQFLFDYFFDDLELLDDLLRLDFNNMGFLDNLSRLRVLNDNSWGLMGIALDYMLRSSNDVLLAFNNNMSWALCTSRYWMMISTSHLLGAWMMSINNDLSSILSASCNIATTCYLLLSSILRIHNHMLSTLATSCNLTAASYLLLLICLVLPHLTRYTYHDTGQSLMGEAKCCWVQCAGLHVQIRATWRNNGQRWRKER